MGSEDDVGVQHGDERVEVAVACGGKEGVDEVSLVGWIGVRFRRRATYAAAGELASWRAVSGERSTIVAISLNGMG